MVKPHELWNENTAGIGLVIDDELPEQNSSINKIVLDLQKHGIPLVLNNRLPETNLLNNLNSISFIILDWELSVEIREAKKLGVTVSQSLIDKEREEILKFLMYVKNNIFCPVFILSNEDIHAIQSYLQDKNLINTTQTNFIFVKSKSTSLLFKQLRSNINRWIKDNPPLYVLNMYEKALAKAKNETFSSFYNLSTVWPTVLYKNAQNDNVDYSTEIFNTIIRNVESRIPYIQLSEDILKSKKRVKVDEKDIQKVIEGQTFIDNEKLKEDDLDVGDIFLGKESGQDTYYINIRPTCNLRPYDGESVEDVRLYLLKGEEFEIPTKKASIKEELILDGKQGHSYYKIYCLYNGKHVKFKFKNLNIMKLKQLKTEKKAKRIGRVLPPYITELRSKYTSYLNRQGLPRIPYEIKSF